MTTERVRYRCNVCSKLYINRQGISEHMVDNHVKKVYTRGTPQGRKKK